MSTIENEIENRLRSAPTVEPERTAREVDTRKRDDFYDLPDYDNFDYKNFNTKQLNLSAPPPRIDEKWGKMRQHWAAYKHANGRRIQNMMESGYRVRRPDTVPHSFRGLTEQWEMRDVIMVAGEHVLMEIPEVHYLKMQRMKHESNNLIIRDIKNSNGDVARIDAGGEIQQLKDNNASRFFRENQVVRGDDGGSIAFDE